MSYLAKLKATKDRKDLARLLGFTPSAMTSIIYQTTPAAKYIEFEIPKKSGGKRVIKAPIPKLKKLQTHLAHVLYACLAEIEQNLDAKSVSYGFRKGRGISGNAKIHKRKRFVLNLDLADFFPTFNFGRVRGFFLKDKSFALTNEVATTIAQIACDGTALPQGSPCSPVISELICHILDVRLLRLARKYGLRYSRYADDITFSTNRKEFPSEIASVNKIDPSTWVIGKELASRIDDCGFVINLTKTRMHCRGSRQMVTGLVVNEKVNIRSEYYRNARAMCDSLFQKGAYFHSHQPPTVGGGSPIPKVTDNLAPLEGILNHIYSVTQKEERRSVQDQRLEPRAIRALYRRFLFYKRFIALDAPLIVTEGKTDPVYLREAIKHLPSWHPLLGQPTADGLKFSLSFFNYGGKSHEIMDLGGGTGDLKSIPLDYLRNLDSSKSDRKPMLHKPMKYPVIMVLDNDDGLGDVAGTIKKNFNVGMSVTSTQDFYHVCDNLYVVKTPEASGKSSMESMFPKSWTTIVLNGKKFNPSNKIDITKEYGKEIFATNVVKANAAKIDFSGFNPLLSRIAKVLDHYAPPAP